MLDNLTQTPGFGEIPAFTGATERRENSWPRTRLHPLKHENTELKSRTAALREFMDLYAGDDDPLVRKMLEILGDKPGGYDETP